MSSTNTAGVRTVPFFVLGPEDEAQLQDLLGAVERVLRHGRFVLGPEVQELEQQLAARTGRRFGVAMSSGSTALWLGLKALGIGAGDEVITTALSWVATANAIALTGAMPVFADVRDDLNIDPATIERLITPRTKAILVVHYTGKMCDMAAVEEIAERRGLLVVEDAAQAFDATQNGRKAGSIGAIGCFSMNAMKVFAACGDAGLVLTDREEVRDRLVRLRYNGTVRREECLDVGANGRIDPLQAAILLRRLPLVDAILERRRQIADRYNHALDSLLTVPRQTAGSRDVWYTYQVRTNHRDALKAHLEACGVEARIQHPILMPDQPIYRHCARYTPHAERVVGEILCLPSSHRLSDGDVDYVIACVRSFFEHLSTGIPE